MDYNFTLASKLFIFFIFSFSLAVAQPANDNFASAITIVHSSNNCSADAAYTTLNATSDLSKGSCWTNGPNYNVWFKFQATTESVTIDLKVGGSEGTMNNPFLALWTSTPTQVACRNYVSSSTDLQLSYYGLSIGDWYYISVDNYVGTGYRGTFTLCIDNSVTDDYFEGATTIVHSANNCSADAAYTTLNYSADRSKGSCWANGPNYNRWFKFQATTESVTIDLKVGGSEGTMNNPFLALWDAAPTQIACQNYVSSTTDLQLSYYGLNIGDWYYISVDNFVGTGYRGTFTLCIDNTVTDDYFEGATTIVHSANNCSADAAYTTLNYTADRSKGSCWTNGPNYNRWFKFQATTESVTIDLKVGGSEGTMNNPFVALWDATPTQIACQNYVSSTTDLQLSYYGLNIGDWYYISVDNYVGTGYRGTFTLCIDNTVTDDYFEGATTIVHSANNCSANAAYTTLNYSADRSKGSCWANGPNYNRWFKFQATTASVTLDLKVGGSEGTMNNPFLALWDDTPTQIACQNYVSSTTDLQLSYYGLTIGNWYYISVDNFVGTGYRGTFTLCIDNTVTDDYFEGATIIVHSANNCSANAAYTTLNYTADRSKGSCWANGPNYNRWFKFQATTASVTIDLKVGGSEGTMNNPFLALWDATPSQIACQNYVSSTTDLQLSYYGLNIGDWYYISVDNFVGTGYRGTFTLCIDNTVTDDYFEGATTIVHSANNCSANAAYTTLNYSADRSKGSCWANGPNYNRWFKFQATTASVTIDLKVGGSEGTMKNPFVALWDATPTQIACQNYISSTTDLQLSYFGLTIGNWYYISVDNYVGSGYRGTFTLCIDNSVNYDYKEGADTLADIHNWCSADAAYTTLNATADQAKGSCWANGPNYNRWFVFEATTSQVNIQVKIGGSEGTMKNPFVALWTAAGSQLACANYISSTADLSLNYGSLTPGVFYYISVDNYVGTGYRGTFSLCVSDTVDYDFKAAAIELSDLDGWCSADGEYTTLNATSDEVKGSCWSNGPNYNRWFKFEALTDTVTVQVKVGGAEGTMRNPFVVLWTAGGSQLACQNYISATADLSISYNSLTPGNTYYISVDNYVGTGYRGTFTLCVNNVSASRYYAITDGDWNTVGTWSHLPGGAATGTVPSAGSVVTIEGYDVSATSTAECANLNLVAASPGTSLLIDGVALTVNGLLSISNAGVDFDAELSLINAANIVAKNDVQLLRNGGANQVSLSVAGTSSVTITRDLLLSSTAGTAASNSISLSNSGTVSVGRDFNITYTGGQTCEVIMNNTATLTVERDLNFSASANNFISFTLNDNSIVNLKGDFYRGASPRGKFFGGGSSTVNINSSSYLQTIAGNKTTTTDEVYFQNLTLNNTRLTSPQVSSDGSIHINGTFTQTAGNFDLGTDTLLVKSSISAAHKLDLSDAVLTFSGSALQAVNGSGSITLNEIVSSNVSGVELQSGLYNLKGVLDIQNGNFNTGNLLTLKSTSSSTAAIGVLSSGTISGDITMERYVGGSEGYRELAASVFDAGVTFEDWDSELITSGIPNSDYPSYSFPSIYSYIESTAGVKDFGYVAIPDMSNQIGKGQGYSVYTYPVPVTIDVTGAPNSGSVAMPVDFTSITGVAEDGWNLVGNPYPCTIDWGSGGVSRTNIDNAIYLYDDANTRWTSYVNGVGTNGGSRYIPSSRGFWVHANAASPVLTIDETAKVPTQDPSLYRSQVDSLFRINFSGNSKSDETVVRILSNATEFFDEEFDAAKFEANGPSFVSLNSFLNNEKYSINTVNHFDGYTEVPLQTHVSASGSYYFDFIGAEIFANYSCVRFVDTDLSENVDLKTDSSYCTTIDANEPIGRFKLVFVEEPEIFATATSCAATSDGSIEFAPNAYSSWNVELFDNQQNGVQKFEAVSNSSVQFTGLIAGIYNIQFQDMHSACSSYTYHVEVPAAPEVLASFSVPDTVLFFDSSNQIQFENQSQNASTYLWDFGNGTTSLDENPIATFSEPGDYWVTLVSTNGTCESSYSQTIYVVNNTTVETVIARDNYSIIKNNRTATVTIKVNNSSAATVRLLDINGRILKIASVGEGVYEIDAAKFAVGLYLIEIATEEFRAIEKWMVN